MAWESCPKCLAVAHFEDRCPRCGVDVNEYLAKLERRRRESMTQPSTVPPPPPPRVEPAAPLPDDLAPEIDLAAPADIGPPIDIEPPAAPPAAPGIPPRQRVSSVPPGAALPPRGPSSYGLPPVGRSTYGVPTELPPERSLGWTIGIWGGVAVVLGLVGWLVIKDWVGAGFVYRAPPGWGEVDDDTLESAIESMCPRARATQTLHAIYTTSLDTSGQAGIGILETDKAIPVNEQSLAMLRQAFERVRAAPVLQHMSVRRAELVVRGGRPAIELEVEMEAANFKSSMFQAILPSPNGSMVFVFVAPTQLYNEQIDAVRISLDSLRARPEGIRAKPWFKHGLRWTWVLAVVIFVFAGISRLRRG